MTLAERCGVATGARERAASEVLERVARDGLNVVRLACVDQHGLVRGKTIVAGELPGAFADGWGLPASILGKDTANRTVFSLFANDAATGGLAALRGARDMVMLPDPATFRVLPWARDAGWVLCDLYTRDGAAMPFSTRGIARAALQRLAARGYEMICGLEVEMHVFALEDAALRLEDAGDAGEPGTPPSVRLTTKGYQHLSELRYDALEPILEVLRAGALALELPLRSLELEYGPSQCEVTFAPQRALDAADAMVLFRNAAKQLCRRHGYHVTFMCRPQIPHVMSSGWHLHQSLIASESGANAFVGDAASGEVVSAVGRAWLGGLLAHAAGATALSTPTINGYRRFRANSLAPDRAAWAVDDRGAMLRVVGEPGDPATHVENRIGEPAANPYLFVASQVIAGLDGLESARDPGPSADAPYHADAPALPGSLGEALAALDADRVLRAGLGEDFVDYFLTIKHAELTRFQQHVTNWEQREYFEVF